MNRHRMQQDACALENCSKPKKHSKRRYCSRQCVWGKVDSTWFTEEAAQHLLYVYISMSCNRAKRSQTRLAGAGDWNISSVKTGAHVGSMPINCMFSLTIPQLPTLLLYYSTLLFYSIIVWGIKRHSVRNWLLLDPFWYHKLTGQIYFAEFCPHLGNSVLRRSCYSSKLGVVIDAIPLLCDTYLGFSFRCVGL